MQQFHQFTHEGKTYKLVYDELFDFKEHDAETLKSLDSGEYVVLGCIVSEPCTGIEDFNPHAPYQRVIHCECCSNSKEIDSLWGIVIEPDIPKVEAFVKEAL